VRAYNENMTNNENENEASFKDSIKKDSLDMLNMRNSPGDTVWASITNLFTRKKPLRFFDVFVGLSIFTFLLIFLAVLVFL
jgi:hypothetical protein